MLHDDPMWLWAADEKNVQIHQCWVDFNYNPLWITPLWRLHEQGLDGARPRGLRVPRQ